MNNNFYYTDAQIIGNLINVYIQNKEYNQLKSLCSSIKNLNHIKDDYRKIISYLEKNKQLSDYLYNYHDKSYNFQHFKQEFKKINKITLEENNIVKVYQEDELLKFHNDDNFRLFVKIIGNTKQLSTILNVKKLQIMWIANTPVWFVPYENLRAVLNTARVNSIDIKVEKMDQDFILK